MKKFLHRSFLVVFPLAACSFLASCTSHNHQSARHASGGGYVTYASLPSGYRGNAYHYNNRYYAGGRYEPGTFSHRGRTYDHRYYHNGQYLYGGVYRQQAAVASYRGAAPRSSTSVSYVTYRTLPRNHTGSAYYYNNLYYAGGRYEPGTYSYRGRTYNHRYFHNGQYLYGGEYRQSPSAVTTQRTIRRSAPAYRTATRRVVY